MTFPRPLVLIASVAVLAALLTMPTTLLPSPVASAYDGPVEDYAAYEPPTRCAPRDRPGAKALARWTMRRFGGSHGGISRGCGEHATSEHNEGRAFDWSVDVRRPADRRRVRRLLAALLAPDAAGNPAALARRMGVMYVIWDDTTWSSWRRFEPAPYLSSSCPSRRECSRTLRHRNHLHISITREAARGELSWYAGRS